jgi:NADH-quinone oxidoreductase subunit F
MGYPHPSHPRETVLLSRYFGDAEARTFAGWTKRGGYRALEKALGMSREQVIEEVKTSGVRGRGGAGFPAGVKWSFMPKEPSGPHYLCCNADEGEPGTFKDRELMRWTPHALVEGCAIAAYAIHAEHVYVYIRGEFTEAIRVMQAAIDEAYAKGMLGRNVLGRGVTIEMTIHRGAGAYICGEETALMNSIEGKRGNPRIKPPFPAVAGLWGRPTTINNVETLTAIPHIIEKGGDWYRALSLSNPKSTGTKLFSICGNVAKPGNYEVTMGFPLRDLLYDVAGGIPGGRQLKAVQPGGCSVPFITAEEADGALLDYEGCVAAGTQLGSGGMIVYDDACDIVYQVMRLAKFYAHESCAQCTQCREGTAWTTKILQKILGGEGRMEDLDVLIDLGEQMTGKTICVLSDSCAVAVVSAIQKFRPDFEAYIRSGRAAAKA